ncbi:purple acid phosphatase-like protein [Leptotrombidium deliense]|uniref:Purple acid phosphatase-like protein n=1 Tax=Leptotrombidium deliense TaxID=299467 RepID=A0A443RYT5_9ACAR|nr:purple acid phosphatase-like protein [Leptotrombidium deliense]
MIENYLEKKENPTWDKEIELTKRVVHAVNQMSPKPKFFVVCGDLVDAFPGNKLRKDQIQDFIKVFSELEDIPLICVCGNHDVGNIPTIETIDDYRQKFGDDFFVFFVGGVMFIAINSQYYADSSKVAAYAKEQQEWLDNLLSRTTSYRHVVVFQHIPWFLDTPEEQDNYFNIEKKLREQMLEKFHKAGVKAIFCGHYHRNAGGRYKNTEVVVTSAIGAQLGNDGSGVRIVKMLTDSIQHQYYAIDQLPVHVKLE